MKLVRVALAKSILPVSRFQILVVIIKQRFLICCSSTSLGNKDKKASSGCSSRSSAFAHDGNNRRTKVDQIMRSLVKKKPGLEAHANNIQEVDLEISTFPF